MNIIQNQFNQRLIPKLYVGAFNQDKLDRADVKRNELIEKDGIERITLTTASGQKIDGYYYDAPQLYPTLDSNEFWQNDYCELPPLLERLPEVGQETVLICFGNSGLCELKYNQLILFFLRYGFNVRVYNHPGYGKSVTKDNISPSELYEAGEAVYDDLRSKLEEDAKILVYGISLGSCVASHIASVKTDDNMVLMLDRGLYRMSLTVGSLVSNMVPVIGSIVGKIIEKLVQLFHEYPNDEKIKSYKKRIALLPAIDDEMLSMQHMTDLAHDYISSNHKAIDPETITFPMPGGHGWKVSSWIDGGGSEASEKFNEALNSLGYDTISV